MKKALCFLILLGILIVTEVFAEEAVRVIALKGPTAMGMAEMMERVKNGDLKDSGFEFSIAGAIDEVTPKILQGKVDIAAVPANVASVLYNNSEKEVQTIAINTLGVLYIVERGNSINSFSDLSGRTIYASGKGATPEYALNYELSSNGIDPTKDVTIEWKSEHAECLAALLADDNAIAMLPQPFVTTACMKNEDIRVALDMTKEWERIQESSAEPSSMITGVVVVRKEYAASHQKEIENFLNAYKESVEYVNTNIEDAAELIGQFDIVPSQVAVRAIPACNIVLITGEEMQQKLSGYLKVLEEQNPKSIGGKIPDSDFYFIAE